MLHPQAILIPHGYLIILNYLITSVLPIYSHCSVSAIFLLPILCSASKNFSKISSAATEMEFPKRKFRLKLKPECIQEKTIESGHNLVKERRLFLAQICAEVEMEAPARKLGSKCKTESFQNKQLNSINEVQKKSRLMEITESLITAQESSERKLGLAKKTDCIVKRVTLVDGDEEKERLTHNLILGKEKLVKKPGLTKKLDWVRMPTTLVDRIGKKGRFIESRNPKEKNLNTDISLKSTKKDEEWKRILCDWKRIKVEKERQNQKERKKQREAARVALDQVKNTCGFEDNMNSMKEFEKIVGCSSTFYIFSRDRNHYDKL